MAIASRLFTTFATLALLSWWVFSQPRFERIDKHRILDADRNLSLPADLDFSPDRDHRAYYHSRAAHDFCAAHGYSVFRPRSSSGERKVYDLSMVNTELDFLEIRLNTLYNYVDYFIIVESTKSFRGNTKPLVIRDNWDKFKPYHDKMIYHLLEFPEGFNPPRAWDYEDLQRDATYDQVVARLTGRQAPAHGDVLLVSDVDEIPRPSTALLLRSCNFPRRLTLASRFYYYSFQFLHLGAEWPHPQATYYTGASTVRPTNLRNGDGGVPLLRDLDKGHLGNAAWHCSSCFSTIEAFLNKMASFSHRWMNKEKYRQPHKIVAAVRNGRDLWGRKQDQFMRVEDNDDLPALLLQDRERFRYMVDRSGESAGFADYP